MPIKVTNVNDGLKIKIDGGSKKRYITLYTGSTVSIATQDTYGVVRGSDSIIIENGRVKIAPSVLENIVEGVATQEWVIDQGYATSSWILSQDYASKTHLNQVLEAYPTSADLDAILVPYATREWVEDNFSSMEWDDILNKPTSFTPSAHTHSISDITNLQTSLNLKLDKSIFDDMFELVTQGGSTFIKAKYALTSVGDIVAFLNDGVPGDDAGGIIETVYGYGNLGGSFSNSTLTDTFNAYTINQINNRLISVENGSATSISTTGSGNAITSVSKSGNTITFTKGSTFSLNGHTHSVSDITNLQSGHVIQNVAGTDMPTQPALQFGAGFTVTDEEGKTVVGKNTFKGDISAPTAWDGTLHNIDLSSNAYQTLTVNNGVTVVAIGVTFPEDANEKMYEKVILIDNSNNNSAIASIVFDDNSGAYSWEWSVGDPINGIPAKGKAELHLYNRSATVVKALTDIES